MADQASSPAADAERKPNILFILADDLGWADVGFHDPVMITPNLDRLASDGIRLEQYYVTPTCSPTRTCLMTGRYASRFGVLTPINQCPFEPGQLTLASVLRQCGYRTSIVGKWHMGSLPQWGPNRFGFDFAYGSLAGGVTPYGHRYKEGAYSKTWHRNGELIEETGHVTDLIGAEAVRQIEQAHPHDKPFFIYVAFTAPHIPIDEPEKWKQLYQGRIADESRLRFAACVTHMDAAIGEMLAALDRTGQRDHTIIVFASDNGAQQSWSPEGLYPGQHRPSPVLGSNLPFRGWKGELYEGGIRVPAIVNWRGVLRSGRREAPIHVVDWMPTLRRLAGCRPANEAAWDGRDIWKLIADPGGESPARVLYWRTPDQRAVLRGGWKLVISGERRELFDLRNDPRETDNQIEQQPSLAEGLEAILHQQASRDANETLSFTTEPAPH